MYIKKYIEVIFVSRYKPWCWSRRIMSWSRGRTFYLLYSAIKIWNGQSILAWGICESTFDHLINHLKKIYFFLLPKECSIFVCNCIQNIEKLCEWIWWRWRGSFKDSKVIFLLKKHLLTVCTSNSQEACCFL